jgi:hypothetical protein
VPEAGRIFWRFFVELSATRTHHMGGPNPISHAEIDAWARLHRWPLTASHVGIIRALDDAWLAHAYAAAEKRDAPKPPPGKVQKMNPAAFDAVFA